METTASAELKKVVTEHYTSTNPFLLSQSGKNTPLSPAL